MKRGALGIVLVLAGCPAPSTKPTAATSSAGPAPTAPVSAEPVADASVATKVKPKPKIGADNAERVLFLKTPTDAARACRESGTDAEQITCMIKVRYTKDKKASDAAVALYEEHGIVAGIEPRQTMDGGWRGMIELVPELPVGRHRRHLRWMVPAYRDFATFFSGLESKGGAKAKYRYQPIRLRYFRSVNRTTPSAYASGWTIAYNVSGSLHSTADAVRETMFHETFHLNDRAHAGWSRKALSDPYDDIVARCTKNGKLSTACLRPYAPNETMVRGGTYYAFQPGNGVWEYAAELAIRYYREHRAVLGNKKLTKKAFKCGPAPNAKTWKLLADEFFGGIDLVPPC